jgi:hypothetical protein
MEYRCQIFEKLLKVCLSLNNKKAWRADRLTFCTNSPGLQYEPNANSRPRVCVAYCYTFNLIPDLRLLINRVSTKTVHWISSLLRICDSMHFTCLFFILPVIFVNAIVVFLTRWSDMGENDHTRFIPVVAFRWCKVRQCEVKECDVSFKAVSCGVQSCGKHSVSCKNWDSKDSLNKRQLLIPSVYSLRRIHTYDKFKSIITEIGQITHTVTVCTVSKLHKILSMANLAWGNKKSL